MEKNNTYIDNDAPSSLICTQTLTLQKFKCFLCDVSIFPSTALYRCVIPRTDRYWARVYGEIGATLAFQRAKQWRGFCSQCAPGDAVRRRCAPSIADMRKKGPGEVPAETTNWLIKNRFLYRHNWNRKFVAAYANF